MVNKIIKEDKTYLTLKIMGGDMGRCECSKCGKILGGKKQTQDLKKKWRSPCCNAKGINWKIAVWIEDTE